MIKKIFERLNPKELFRKLDIKGLYEKIKPAFAKLKNVKCRTWIIAGACTATIVSAVLIALPFLSSPELEEVVIVDTTRKVGISIPSDSALDTQTLTQLILDKGYETVVFSGVTNLEQQLQQVEQMTNEGYSLIIVQAFSDAAATDILVTPQKAGIPVMFIDYKGQAPDIESGATFISQDPAAPGLFQGELAKNLPAGGDINGDGEVCYALLTGPAEDEEVKKQLNGIRQTLNGYTLLSTRNLNDTQDDGYTHCTDLLATYGKDIEVLICGTRELSFGSVKAVIEASRNPGSDIYLICIGDGEEINRWIVDGVISGSVAQDNAIYINRIADTAHTILSGHPYNLQYYANYYTITGSHYN